MPRHSSSPSPCTSQSGAVQRQLQYSISQREARQPQRPQVCISFVVTIYTCLLQAQLHSFQAGISHAVDDVPISDAHAGSHSGQEGSASSRETSVEDGTDSVPIPWQLAELPDVAAVLPTMRNRIECLNGPDLPRVNI